MYTGVTSDLIKRISEYKEIIHKGSFSAKYNCKKLVYYESFDTIESAIIREKQIKNWKRSWKIELIEKENKDWEDLFYKLIEQ